jgi:hypothetical protein
LDLLNKNEALLIEKQGFGDRKRKALQVEKAELW